MRLGGLKTRSGVCGKDTNFFPLLERKSQPSSPHLSQYRLSYSGSYIVSSIHTHIGMDTPEIKGVAKENYISAAFIACRVIYLVA
jgi:hypothetical protein